VEHTTSEKSVLEEGERKLSGVTGTGGVEGNGGFGYDGMKVLGIS
jgi:hypothetical protein